MSGPADDWQTVGQPATNDDWQTVGGSQAPQPDDRTGMAMSGLATLPAAFIDRFSRGAALSSAVEKAGKQATPQDIIGDDWERLREAGIVSDPYTGRPGAVTGHSLFEQPKPSVWQQLGHAFMSDVTRFIDDLKTTPQRAFEESERLRTQGDFDPGPIINGAMMGTGAGGEFLPGGVKFARPTETARPLHQEIGTAPTDVDFANAAKAGGLTEARLKEAWEERGIHPAEAAHDAEHDAMLRHDLSSAAANPADLPSADVPYSDTPKPPPGRVMAAVRDAADGAANMGHELQMLVAPMATGTRDSMAIAKDFANAMRRNRWEWSRVDKDIAKRFNPEQRTRMWNAADEESVLRQEGKTSEHMGLATLEPAERAAVEDLQARAQTAWLRVRDLGMVEGEGLPAYTPRMVINAANALAEDKALPLNSIGANLRATTASLKNRKYLTAEETEAAAKAKYGDQAELARDIRVLPLATSKLEDAIAGRSLINAIKDYGARTGTETVHEGGIPAGSDTKWFTLDHPAFKAWRPKFKDGAAVKDADGNTVFEQTHLYVHGDFEGPLNAVLSQKNGAIYNALIGMKAKTMGLIMNSPMIHNLVEWGRALSAMPGKVATFKVYFEGNRFKGNVPEMKEAIDNGLVPIGARFFKHSVDDIMSEPDIAPGRSLMAKVAAFVPGLFDEAAGTAVKRAIDKAGDFWHNTLLWDRIGDLQAGLYVNFRDELIGKGVDRQTAARAAAHWANRFAGSLPEEAMSAAARKTANVLLFSRSFTLGNLGVMKDMFTGLPKDVLAQIERDQGVIDPKAVGYAKAMARRRAAATVAIDMAFAYAGYSVLQSAMNVMVGDSSLDAEMHGYAQRLRSALQNVKEHPLTALVPFNFIHSVSATSQNEPDRQDRMMVGYAHDGTAIYARLPPGKMGEEFEGYMTGPLDMLRKKLSPLARFTWDVMANDRGFGRKVYDPNAKDLPGWASNMGNIAFHLMEVNAPAGQIRAGVDLVKGDGDAKVNALQLLGPMAGVTFSKGAPGGPAVGELFKDREIHDYAVQAAMPDIRKQIQRGDLAGARDRMNELGIPAGLQRFYVRTTLNPATRLSAKSMRDFYTYATPEQRARMEQLRSVSPLAPQ